MNIRRRLKKGSLKRDRITSCNSINIDIVFNVPVHEGASVDKQFDKIIDAVYIKPSKKTIDALASWMNCLEKQSLYNTDGTYGM